MKSDTAIPESPPNTTFKETDVGPDSPDKKLTPDVAAVEELKKSKCVSKSAIVMVSIPVLLYFAGLRSEISDLKERLALKEVQLQQTTENFGKLSGAIDEQNALIRQAQEAAMAADEASRSLANTLESKKRESEDVVNKILKAAKPKSCEEARRYLIAGVEELKW